MNRAELPLRKYLPYGLIDSYFEGTLLLFEMFCLIKLGKKIHFINMKLGSIHSHKSNILSTNPKHSYIKLLSIEFLIFSVISCKYTAEYHEDVFECCLETSGCWEQFEKWMSFSTLWYSELASDLIRSFKPCMIRNFIKITKIKLTK